MCLLFVQSIGCTHQGSAKARQREREEQASSSSSTNVNGKRPLGVTPATSTSPTKPTPKLKRDSRLGKYFEYDLSKMVNSKGGFLVEDDKEVDEDLRAKEKERERQRAQQSAEPGEHGSFLCTHRQRLTLWAAMFLDPSLNPRCEECNSMDIDHQFRKVFRCLVCNKCKNEKPERYSLLTKTECKEVRSSAEILALLYSMVAVRTIS